MGNLQILQKKDLYLVSMLIGLSVMKNIFRLHPRGTLPNCNLHQPMSPSDKIKSRTTKKNFRVVIRTVNQLWDLYYLTYLTWILCWLYFLSNSFPNNIPSLYTVQPFTVALETISKFFNIYKYQSFFVLSLLGLIIIFTGETFTIK